MLKLKLHLGEYNAFDVVADSRDLHTKIVFPVFDKAANEVATMSWLLGETDRQ